MVGVMVPRVVWSESGVDGTETNALGPLCAKYRIRRIFHKRRQCRMLRFAWHWNCSLKLMHRVKAKSLVQFSGI